jgi:hypothetical protein
MEAVAVRLTVNGESNCEPDFLVRKISLPAVRRRSEGAVRGGGTSNAFYWQQAAGGIATATCIMPQPQSDA